MTDNQIGGKPFTTFYFGAESPKPYLHPLRSAQGTIVTRGWPMVKDIPGESHDHPHHRAMYFAHGDINGMDFWGEKTESRAQQTAKGKFYSSEELPKGRTVFVKLDEMESKGIPEGFAPSLIWWAGRQHDGARRFRTTLSAATRRTE